MTSVPGRVRRRRLRARPVAGRVGDQGRPPGRRGRRPVPRPPVLTRPEPSVGAAGEPSSVDRVRREPPVQQPQLAVQERVDVAQPLLRAGRLEQGLLAVDLHLDDAREQERERRRVVRDAQGLAGRLGVVHRHRPERPPRRTASRAPRRARRRFGGVRGPRSSRPPSPSGRRSARPTRRRVAGAAGGSPRSAGSRGRPARRPCRGRRPRAGRGTGRPPRRGRAPRPCAPRGPRTGTCPPRGGRTGRRRSGSPRGSRRTCRRRRSRAAGRAGAQHLAALADQHHAERRGLVEAPPDHDPVPLLEHVEGQGDPGGEDGVEREQRDLHRRQALRRTRPLGPDAPRQPTSDRATGPGNHERRRVSRRRRDQVRAGPARGP